MSSLVAAIAVALVKLTNETLCIVVLQDGVLGVGITMTDSDL